MFGWCARLQSKKCSFMSSSLSNFSRNWTVKRCWECFVCYMAFSEIRAALFIHIHTRHFICSLCYFRLIFFFCYACVSFSCNISCWNRQTHTWKNYNVMNKKCEFFFSSPWFYQTWKKKNKQDFLAKAAFRIKFLPQIYYFYIIFQFSWCILWTSW